MSVKKTGPNLWRCDYVAPSLGLHSINVHYAGKPIPKSPFGVKVSPASDPRKVKASGRGLQPDGIRVRDKCQFTINTEGAGEGAPSVEIIGPDGSSVNCAIEKTSPHLYNVKYQPTKEGKHVLIIKFAGKEIHKSPFDVNVGPYKETLIKAYGPGLEGGIIGYPALFTVETNGETGALGFSIQGPSQAKIECHDNGDGSADVRYYPTAPGEYAVHILCDNEDIPRSPFIAQISPNVDFYPEKVNVFGPGVETNSLRKGVPATFTTDVSQAGNAQLDVKVRTNIILKKSVSGENWDDQDVFSSSPPFFRALLGIGISELLLILRFRAAYAQFVPIMCPAIEIHFSQADERCLISESYNEVGCVRAQLHTNPELLASLSGPNK